VNPGTSGGDQDNVTLAGGDQCGGVENCGNPQRAGPPGARSETEFKGYLRAVGSDDPVNFVRADACVGKCAQGANQRDRRRVMFRESSRLNRVENAGNGDVAEGV
jgi:hypothetical protein